MFADAWISSETGHPFSHCIHCRLPLEETDSQWLVNKQFHRGECVLEYAICATCRDEVTREFSEESRAAIRRFLEKEIDWPVRLSAFMMMHDPSERLEACVKCTAPRASLDGFGISALFDSGGHLTTGPLPLLMCDDCIGGLKARLSDDSRRVWADFLASHFPGPLDDPLMGLF